MNFTSIEFLIQNMMSPLVIAFFKFKSFNSVLKYCRNRCTLHFLDFLSFHWSAQICIYFRISECHLGRFARPAPLSAIGFLTSDAHCGRTTINVTSKLQTSNQVKVVNKSVSLSHFGLVKN